jgi:acetoin utilization protein AcuB
MVDHKIGSLPIVRGKQVVGIVTETDVFRTMAEALGGRAKGLRVTLRVPDVKGELAMITNKVAELGGNFVSFATFLGGDKQHTEISFKVQEVKKEAVIAALEKTGAQILDVREIIAEYQPTLISSR